MGELDDAAMRAVTSTSISSRSTGRDLIDTIGPWQRGGRRSLVGEVDGNGGGKRRSADGNWVLLNYIITRIGSRPHKLLLIAAVESDEVERCKWGEVNALQRNHRGVSTGKLKRQAFRVPTSRPNVGTLPRGATCA